MKIARDLGLAVEAERALADAFLELALRHQNEPDVRTTARLFSSWCKKHVEVLRPFTQRFGRRRASTGKRLRQCLFKGIGLGASGLLRDLHALMLMTAHVRVCWTVLGQCAQALHDGRLESAAQQCGDEAQRQLAWLDTRIRHLAPHAVLVAADPLREMAAAMPSRTSLAATVPMATALLVRRSLPKAMIALTAAAAALSSYKALRQPEGRKARSDGARVLQALRGGTKRSL